MPFTQTGTSLRCLCRPGRLGRASRFEFDGFTFPPHDKRHDLRLSVESSALFTLKNDEHTRPAALPASPISCAWPSPGGTSTTRAPRIESTSVESEFMKCACASSRARELVVHTPVHTSRHGRYFVRVAYINDLFPLLLWTQHCTICLVDVSINMYMR